MPTIYPTNDLLFEMIQRRNATLDNPGWCINCGTEQAECEPDAVAYTCDDCGKPKVYGEQELLLRGWWR